MSFEDDINRAMDGMRRDLTKRARRIALKAFSDVIKATPVDTGTARANWRVGMGSPNYEYNSSASDKSGSVTISAMNSAVDGLLPGQNVYLSNSCPYIMRLECDGWSKQAPNGMVSITAASVQGLIDRGLL